MSSLAQVYAHRNLISNLARRDLKAKYKRSVLGWLWSLINPAATLGVYTLVFGVILGGNAPLAGNGELRNFALFLFSGLVIWNLFANTLNSAMQSFEGSSPLLTKIYFPPECPAVAGVAGVVMQSVLELVVLMTIMAVLGNVSWTIVLFPVIFLIVALFAGGLGMVLSLMNIRYRDVSYLVGILLQVLFYCTPIVYDVTRVPKRVAGLPARQLFELSPTTQFVICFRDIVYFLRMPPLSSLLYLVAVTAVVFTGAWWWFGRTAPKIIEEL